MNLGIGGAVQTGIKYARDHDYDLCVQVDGDGQHPPGHIKILVDSYRAEPANLIIGSRFLHRAGFKSTWRRRFGIRVIRSAIRFLYGHTLTDPTSGFRLMDRAAIRIFSRDYPQDFPEPISAAVALRQGLTIREVPVDMRCRQAGTSSIDGWHSLWYMLRVVGYLTLLRVGTWI
jgi:glycosyltransferase involved in cell wall biosynthesis